MNDPLRWIDPIAADWAERGLERKPRVFAGSTSRGVIETAEGRVLINLASNDYLSLACDPRVVAAGKAAADRYGWGASASPLVTGLRLPHVELARDLAAFERTEAAVLFPSGYSAGVATIAAVVGKGDVVFSDRLNHACLIDGIRLSRAETMIYPHIDMQRLSELLGAERSRFRRALIVTESIFGMDGDAAPIADLVDLADRHDAMLMVDEAHATGVYGPEGRGIAAEQGVSERVPIKMGTLSKALGSIGGFVAGSNKLIGLLTNHARGLVFSTAIPPSAAAAANEALRIIAIDNDRRDRLLRLGVEFRAKLAERGIETISPRGPIVPIVIGDPRETVALGERLREQGFVVAAIRPPTVPPGTSRLRLSLAAEIRLEDLEPLIQTLAEAKSSGVIR